MAWVSLDDGFPDHRKVAGLSDAAFRLHVSAICYCNRQLTDGLIEDEEVPRLVRKFKRPALQELLDRGIWRQAGAGVYEIHDYLDWNAPREVVLKRREDAKDRARKARTKS